MNSKETQEEALKHQDYDKLISVFPKEMISKYTVNLTGLSACDVEKGTEAYWLNEGREQLDILKDLYCKLIQTKDEWNITNEIIIGLFRNLQEKYTGKTNLSFVRLKVLNRLMKRVDTDCR